MICACAKLRIRSSVSTSLKQWCHARMISLHSDEKLFDSDLIRCKFSQEHLWFPNCFRADYWFQVIIWSNCRTWISRDECSSESWRRNETSLDQGVFKVEKHFWVEHLFPKDTWFWCCRWCYIWLHIEICIVWFVASSSQRVISGGYDWALWNADSPKQPGVYPLAQMFRSPMHSPYTTAL